MSIRIATATKTLPSKDVVATKTATLPRACYGREQEWADALAKGGEQAAAEFEQKCEAEAAKAAAKK